MTFTQPNPDQVEVTEFTVATAQRGNHDAIGALGADAFRRTVAFYRYTGLSAANAEDLAADAVEHIISKLPTLKKTSAYNAWMWTIIRNLLRSFWRSENVRETQEPIAPAPMEPQEIAIIHEEHDQIVRALQTLSINDRELLWLREVLELNYRSISHRTGSNVGSVRVACHRARQRLESAYTFLEGDST
jgi:RNA polymerase sigma-70 factor (ECF subfamily)